MCKFSKVISNEYHLLLTFYVLLVFVSLLLSELFDVQAVNERQVFVRKWSHIYLQHFCWVISYNISKLPFELDLVASSESIQWH